MPKQLSEDRFNQAPFIPKESTDQASCGTSQTSEAAMSNYSLAHAKCQQLESYLLKGNNVGSVEEAKEMLRLAKATLEEIKAIQKRKEDKLARTERRLIRMQRRLDAKKRTLETALALRDEIEEIERKKFKRDVSVGTISTCGTVEKYLSHRIKDVSITSAFINTFATANGDRAFHVESITLKNTTNFNKPINLKGLSITCSNGEMVNITNDLELSSANRLMELRVDEGPEDTNDTESLRTLSREDDKLGIIILKGKEGKVIEVVTYSKDNVKSGMPVSFEKSEPSIPKVICIVQDDNLSV